MMDAYDRRARLQPALLVALPLALSLVPLLRELPAIWQATAPLLVATGGSFAVAHLARWAGRRAEPGLFAAWGGAPTTHLLRHRGPAGTAAVAHRHKQIARLYPHLSPPTPEEEVADPDAADATYIAAVLALREATRDCTRFPLLAKENRAYGFCRNLLGLRPYGIAFAVIALGVALGALAGETQLGVAYTIALFGALAIDVAALVFWVVFVSPEWTRVAADAYAERLLGAADQLP